MPVTIVERFTSTVSIRSVRNMLIDTSAIFYRLRLLHFYERDIRGKTDATLFERSTGEVHAPKIGETGSSLDSPSAQRLRILILNWRDVTNPRAGGAEIYTQNVATEWVREGHSVTLFCSSVRNGPTEEDFDGVHIIRRGSHLSVYRQAKRFYRREGKGAFDLVIEEINTRPFFARKWINDSPVIALIHQVCRELWYYQFSFPLAFLGRHWFEPKWLHGYRDVLTVTVSESSEQSLRAYGLRRIVVVPEGHRALDERPSVAREVTPTIVFVGRLEAHKRPEDAIEAFRLLRQSMPEAVLWLIGSGSMEDKLRMTAPDGVHFLGKVSPAEKTERLARAHVLIATSVREGWGLVVTEAAEVGTPTIAYDVPGLSDSVTASSGVLVAPDPRSLSICLEERLRTWLRDGLPQVSPGGVVSWDEVAKRILSMAPPKRLTLDSSSISPDTRALNLHKSPESGR
jgi:glycosyltransferase involved in cell wall biosynthesis